ncbi:MAG: Rpn family recombination-promoting nuclease/putative transposase [Planctomycetaceae bacterium]|nr:Rpn family recombination-promoting nuclease/putative transposase [Planctomycetaceae bacterium]
MSERVLISFDYAMKLVLRNKIDFEILEGFLSELLNCDVSVRNIGESESNKKYPGNRVNRVDILVEAEAGEIILVELQFESEADYLHRMLFGTSNTITDYMSQGKKYVGVKKVYSINIVYFDLGQGSDYVYHGKTHFTGLHNKDELRLTDAQRKMFGKELAGDIYPEYYILKVSNFGGDAKDTLDEWMYFFKTNIIKEDFHAKGIVKAREVLTEQNLTLAERREYNRLQSERSHDLSQIATAEDKGREEGIEIGRKKGKEEGIEIGRVEREKLAKEIEAKDKKLKELEKLVAEMDKSKQNEKK